MEEISSKMLSPERLSSPGVPGVPGEGGGPGGVGMVAHGAAGISESVYDSLKQERDRLSAKVLTLTLIRRGIDYRPRS